ncbi:MAG: hypothetical protein A2W00_03355 [Candidatus Eisenbacteria bacterium RBG_16_71_46]|nr:MAG: hypothetical protein A2W00_03355 [Candidatus Eisenbacteria bacterium RBG_16_71_46]
MSLPIDFQPTMAGVVFAAAAVVGGGPLFSDGLRALRLRRRYRGLRLQPLADAGEGLVCAHGRVALESPLFSPLTACPCAGYRLEVRSADDAVVASLDVARSFRLIGDGAHAVVAGPEGRWDLAVSGERRVESGEALSENLEALIRELPEAVWLRMSGAPMRLVERALPAGAVCHVIGYASRARGFERAGEVEWMRTGTDDRAIAALAEAAPGPEMRIGPGDQLAHLIISDHAPDPARAPVGALRALGVVVGPALTLVGLLYLAAAADSLASSAGF